MGANLSAYLYWETHWLRKYEQSKLNLFAAATTTSTTITSGAAPPDDDPWEWSEKDDDDNIEWCKENGLNPSSMRSIKEIIECTMNALYLGKHEPTWLRS